MRDDPAVVALVKRAQDGDQRAWDQLVERYAPLVWSVCRRYRLSPVDSDEVGANVWLRLVEGLGKLREPAALPGWLATVAGRECLRVLRERRGQVQIEGDEFADETTAEADAELLRQERFIALRQAFTDLPERCRRLLTLLFGEPPTPYKDISRSLGMRIGGIGPTRRRCLDELREHQALAQFADLREA